VKQQASPVTVALDDAAVADYMDACVDAGLTPERCLRIWCHTHPGSSPEPSGTDEHTFARVFGACQWAVMFIVSRTAATFARLSFHVGPVAAIDVPVVVDWKSWPADLADRAATQLLASWQDEHRANIHGFPKQQAITPVADEKPLGGSPPEHTAPVWDWDEIDDRLLEEYERYFGCFAFD
jgi:proteasome lid subunit RPN8/RPN11